jgi:glutathione S-transferase
MLRAMIRLYDNAFSPFARKVRLALDHKGLAYEVTDGLSRANRSVLEAVNGRVEVPAITHDGVVVVNSSDILAYLERVFPERPLYPASPAGWARARAWERCSDTTVDAILIDISYWVWAERSDVMPAGLLDAARRDLAEVYTALEHELAKGDPSAPGDTAGFVCGALSVADLALFPQLTGAKLLGVPFDGDRWPRLLDWYKRMRALPICQADLARVKEYLGRGPENLDVERKKIFWRGDRLEWLLAKGYHAWLLREIEEDRVLWPGLAIPKG